MVSDLESAAALIGECPVISQLRGLFSTLRESCPDQAEVFVFSPAVMRGFDYYTGIVFEAYDNHPSNRRALFGGGRYDDLVASFGAEPLAGVGYGVSEISILNFLKTHDLLPDLGRQVDVYAFNMGNNARSSVIAAAAKLRDAGFSVELSCGFKKLAKQFSYGERIGAQAVLFAGDDELEKDQLCLKNLVTGEQISRSSGELLQLVSG